jgi:glycerol-3-phosphate dehydrogenase
LQTQQTAQSGADEFALSQRAKTMSQLAEAVFDIAIIGGGITGAGVARDAASRGMRVALIEAKDFAVGTSSRSSKLIHGGIRYLENLEFGLVFEALSERRLLFEIAPHLVHPLRFVLPLYKGSRVGMFKMGLGMWLYDALSMFEAPELHERLSAEESVERLPLLQANNLMGSYEYSDAYMDDDRLVIETLRSAVKLGAQCVSYVSAEDAELIDGKVRSVGCTDHLTGKKLRIRARHFVSTVGPWTDQVGHHLLGEWKKVLRPSKGVHLTFERKRLQLNQAVVMAADDDKRIVFGIPRHEMVVIGTTDTDYPGDPYDVSTTKEDVSYLLDVAGQYFPGAKLKAEDIVASYAGVRPLVDDGASTESKTSREHLILPDPRNITFVAGGKYTTYRLMAAQTVQAALKFFSLEDQIRFARNDTKRPLNELATTDTIEQSERQIDRWSREFDLSSSQVAILVDRHGGEALNLLERGRKSGASLSQLTSVRKRFSHTGQVCDASEEILWSLEAEHAIHNTMCFHLLDFYTRRSPLILARRDHGLSFLATLSRVFSTELGWSDSQRQAEAATVQAYIRHELGWKQSFSISPASV